MTGMSAREHGDRIFDTTKRMPECTTLAQSFRDAGYQAYGVGKMHVYPQRDRIGFDDVILSEEGRVVHGVIDDYDQFLAEKGHVGEQFLHCMGNNQYWVRPWHLDDELHVTNWTTREMMRTIKRRDPTRPAFWYASYTAPHPPLVPLQAYLDMYSLDEIELPGCGEWAKDFNELPLCVANKVGQWGSIMTEKEVRMALRAFYASCTQVDHQIRLLIGVLSQEGLLDDTIIVFTSDHGEMLGKHGIWAKSVMYEESVNVPMIVQGATGDDRVGIGVEDDRLVLTDDVMPTLLGLCGIDVPGSVSGMSMFGDEKREYVYGEIFEKGGMATRMMRDERYKLIYYPVGNRFQLFDLLEDKDEMHDLSESGGHAEVRERLKERLVLELYGSDEEWLKDGEFVGLPKKAWKASEDRTLFSQRGIMWPPPPPRV